MDAKEETDELLLSKDCMVTIGNDKFVGSNVYQNTRMIHIRKYE